MERDEHNIRSYGDTYNDGAVQLSFTLPVECSAKAKEAALQYAEKMGLAKVLVTHMHDLGEGFTFFVVYGHFKGSIDLTKIKVEEIKIKRMNMYEVDKFINERIKRKLVVVGACIESDAHSIGIDAIMNMKGYHGDYGLERYKEIKAYNLGAQVLNAELVKKAIELKADVILVSQIVTQKDIHIRNMTNLVELLEAEGLRSKVVLICGGPRLSHKLALELGFDAGFGPGTVPSEVASFFVQRIAEKKK